jgi:hypothetical protein
MINVQQTIVLAALTLASVQLRSPDDLLRRSDVGAFAPSSFRAHLTLTNPAQHEPHEIEVWRSGEGRTLIRLLDPKERGKYLLRLDGEVWFIAPGAKKPIHLSPSYRLYGGATLDEVLGLRLARAYRVDSLSREHDADGALAVLELRATSDGALFPQVRYVVREATERPVSATYRLRSGREATSVAFFNWNDRGPLYARKVIVKDLLRKGTITEVDIRDLQERAIPDGLFSLDDPSARRALENAAAKNP